MARQAAAGTEIGSALYDWWNISQIKNVDYSKTAHPCQIPLEIMVTILRITPAAVVIDPFAGSGTTLLAAKQLKRRAIGVELSREYCEIIAERLAGGSLFGRTSIHQR